MIKEYRETVLAVVIRHCPNGGLQICLIWSNKAALEGECSHTFPGGGVEAGEGLEAAMKRELSEEVCLNSEEYSLHRITHGDSDFIGPSCGDLPKRYHFFLARCLPSTVVTPGPEAAGVGWFHPRQVVDIAGQALSENKQLMLSKIVPLILGQYPKFFSGSGKQLKRIPKNISLQLQVA